MTTSYSTVIPTDHYNELETAIKNTLNTDIYLSTTTTTTVSTTISNSALSLTVADSSSFASEGIIKIGNERMTYSDNSSNILTLSERGTFGTVPERHRDGATVTLYNVATLQEKIQPDLTKLKEESQPYLMIEVFESLPDDRETFQEWIQPYLVSLVVVVINDDYAAGSRVCREITSQLRSYMRSQARDVSFSDNIDGIITGKGDIFVLGTTFSEPDDYFDGKTYFIISRTMIRIVFQNAI